MRYPRTALNMFYITCSVSASKVFIFFLTTSRGETVVIMWVVFCSKNIIEFFKTCFQYPEERLQTTAVASLRKCVIIFHLHLKGLLWCLNTKKAFFHCLSKRHRIMKICKINFSLRLIQSTRVFVSRISVSVHNLNGCCRPDGFAY